MLYVHDIHVIITLLCVGSFESIQTVRQLIWRACCFCELWTQHQVKRKEGSAIWSPKQCPHVNFSPGKFTFPSTGISQNAMHTAPLKGPAVLLALVKLTLMLALNLSLFHVSNLHLYSMYTIYMYTMCIGHPMHPPGWLLIYVHTVWVHSG